MRFAPTENSTRKFGFLPATARRTCDANEMGCFRRSDEKADLADLALFGETDNLVPWFPYAVGEPPTGNSVSQGRTPLETEFLKVRSQTDNIIQG
jgi:hypothetical protein